MVFYKIRCLQVLSTHKDISEDLAFSYQAQATGFVMGTEDEVLGRIRLLIDVESSRSNHFKHSNITICMVPDSLRKLNPEAYTPRITSIGPLHREDERLKAMEEHKVTYMNRLFRRTEECTKKDMKQITSTCVQAILGVVTRARACYAPNYEDSKFAEILVIDGCFLLELLYWFQYGTEKGDDPIFYNSLVTYDIKNDLLLLENQIPFFILEILFNITLKRIFKQDKLTVSLTDLIFCFIKDMNIINNVELKQPDESVEHCHILGFFQSCYRPRAKEPVETKKYEKGYAAYSATGLAGAGVRFMAQRDEEALLKVEFEPTSFRETCFKIPVLCIKNCTPSLLRNLIAYEQCNLSTSHYITSFAFLLDRLIETKDDVSLLVSSKVLIHSLGSNEDITNLFNNICNGVDLQEFHYSEEWIKLDEYCNQFWQSILISLRRIYRSTTWKTLTVIAAMIIFILTLVQTIYTV